MSGQMYFSVRRDELTVLWRRVPRLLGSGGLLLLFPEIRRRRGVDHGGRGGRASCGASSWLAFSPVGVVRKVASNAVDPSKSAVQSWKLVTSQQEAAQYNKYV
jgi:hypothetical protein